MTPEPVPPGGFILDISQALPVKCAVCGESMKTTEIRERYMEPHEIPTKHIVNGVLIAIDDEDPQIAAFYHHENEQLKVVQTCHCLGCGVDRVYVSWSRMGPNRLARQLPGPPYLQDPPREKA